MHSRMPVGEAGRESQVRAQTGPSMWAETLMTRDFVCDNA
jgi:hypothetical protein